MDKFSDKLSEKKIVDKLSADINVSNDKHRLNLAFQGAGAVVLAVIAFVLVLLLSVNNVFKFDMTAQKRFTLAPFSVKTVNTLKDPVTFTFFVSDSDDESKAGFKDIMEGYVSIPGSKVSYEFYDIRKNPTLAQELQARSNGEVVVQCGKRSEHLYNITEEGITSAIISVSSKEKSTIYFASGHGEITFDRRTIPSISNLKKSLLAEGYKVEELDIRDKGIPSYVKNLAVIAPRTAFTESESNAFKKWFKEGGNVFLTLDPSTGSNYDWMLSMLGVKSSMEIVIDMKQANGGEPVFVVTDIYDGACTATKGLNAPTCYKTARPVDRDLTAKVSNLNIVPLVSTDINAFSVKIEDVRGLTEKSQIRPVRQGVNIPLIQSIERELAKSKEERSGSDENAKQTKTFRAIVSGDSAFITNELFGSAQVVNKDLAMNMFSWLSGSETNLEIRSKDTSSEPLMLSGRSFGVFSLFVILILPSAIFFYGLSVVIKRKRR